MNPIFYAVSINLDSIDEGTRCPYYYLHGLAESLNGYDICNGNGDAMYNCLREGAFLCKVKFTDGSLRDAICLSKFEWNRMKGLVCLLEDESAISNAVDYLGFKSTPSMYSDEEEQLRSSGKYKLLVPYYSNHF